MSSRARNFRRRAGDDDDDAGNADGNNLAGLSKPKDPNSGGKPKKPPPPPKAPKLLSFADDEGEDSIRPPRTDRGKLKSLTHMHKSVSSTHKLTPSKDRLSSSSPTVSVPSNVQPQAGEYTVERLRELQKNTRTLASSKPSESKSRAEPVVVLKGVVLKGLIKPDSEGGLEEERKKADSESFRRERDEAEYRLSNMGIGKISTGSSSDSLFPDQAMINAIRAKRERLRQSRAAPDYISLESRGLSDDEGDFQGRIALIGEKATEKGKGVFEAIEEGPAIVADVRLNGQIGIEEDEDEEEKKWEEEQFRKGLGKRVDDAPKSNGVSVVGPVVHTVQPQGFAYSEAYQSASSGCFGAGGVPRIAEVRVLSISEHAQVATQALRESVKRLKESHGKTTSLKDATNGRLTESLKNIDDLEKSLSDAKEKFNFMYELRYYVKAICQFLQDKAPYIEELEEQMQRLHEKRASAIIERRVADDGDEMVEVEAAISAAKSVLSKGSSELAAIMAAQAALSTARERSNLPVQLDEFGRDINLQKRLDLARRTESRRHKRDRSESKRRMASSIRAADQRIEGESSTDESDSESSAYTSMRNELLQTAKQVFSDADDEYAELSLVKDRFSEWKKYYLGSYQDAYMSLSAPTIFSPYVRLELLKWDPLYEDADFNNMRWHSLLFDYGLPESQNDFSPDDADVNLIPELVEKVALPILHHDIAHCWDILSTRGTKNAVSATKLVISYVPASSSALQELLAAIHTRLADAVANLIVPTWDTLVIKAVPDAARIAAYRFGLSVRLLKNICLWKDILALRVLEQLALDELLCGKILPHVRSVTPNIHDAITRTERVTASLSEVWSSHGVTGEHSSKLHALVEYIMTLAKLLEKKHLSGGSGEEETYGLARRLKKMLVEVNEYDKARVILRNFHLKEAL